MRTGTGLIVALIAVLAAAVAPGAPANAQAPTPAAATASRQPLLQDGRAGLYERVIMRPGAAIFEQPRAGATSRPVPGFTTYYVYGRPGDGRWLEVGQTLDGRTQGWVEAGKAIGWKHNLVLAFNNPAGRERAMFFGDGAAAKNLWLSGANRAAEATRLRTEAQAGRDGPVIALEPDTHVDITRQFYFLPILTAEQLETARLEKARLLEVISAPAPVTRRPQADVEALNNYKGVVVFVIDTSMSMGPYIEETREAVKRVIARIRDTAVRDNFRFGVIAYRDHMGGNPALEYVTLPAYLPSFQDPPEKVVEGLSKLSEAKANNQDFDEDAIAGLKLALDRVPWSEYGGRFIVLITDAGTRDAHDPLSATRLGIPEIKALAKSEAMQVAIGAIHLRTPEGQVNHARAERQYKELTDFSGAGSFYLPVAGGNPAEFRRVVDSLADALLQQVANTVGRPIGAQRPAQTPAEQQIARQSEVIGTAMRLSYLGRTRQQAAPDVVRSYVLDEDPVDPKPARKPLDVRVLLTKNQLSDVAKTIRTIIDAANANRLSPTNFFDQVKAASSATMLDPRRIADSNKLAGAFGEFLQGLPYRSPITEITSEMWKDMAPSERRELVNALQAKLRLYEELNAQTSLWVNIDGRQGGGDTFYPLPIDQLP